MSLGKRVAVSVLLYLGTALWTAAGMVLAWPAYTFFRIAGGLTRREAVRKLIWLYGRGWVVLAGFFMPIGRHRGPIAVPSVIVANHASLFDVYFMGAQPQWNVCMALKGWPFRIPGYVWFMRAAGYLNLDELSVEEILEAGLEELRRGAALLFFPEGTRSRDGRLGRFRSGAFLVAVRSGAPVVPLCFVGTHSLLPRGAIFVRPTRVVVHALSPVDVEEYRNMPDGHIALAKRVRGLISRALAEMSMCDCQTTQT